MSDNATIAAVLVISFALYLYGCFKFGELVGELIIKVFGLNKVKEYE